MADKTCTVCNGTGRRPEFMHVYNGVCLPCGGLGHLHRDHGKRRDFDLVNAKGERMCTITAKSATLALRTLPSRIIKLDGIVKAVEATN